MFKNKADYYQSLYEIAAAVNSAHNPDDVLHSIVETIAKAVDAKGCSLMLLSPDKKLLLHTTAYGLSDWYVRKGPVSADKSISEALNGKPVNIMDATVDERVQYRAQAKKEGIFSILSVPITLKGEIIGVIRVYTGKPRLFDKHDIYFISAAANLGAIALENARLYESLKKDYDTFRQEILEWRAALGFESIAEPDVIPAENFSEAVT